MRSLFCFQTIVTLFFPLLCQAMQIEDGITMPVMGNLQSKKNGDRESQYLIKTDSLKAYSPIEGTVFYVGQFQDKGLSVIIKNAYHAAIISNLDRVSVAKNQYLMQSDTLGSVEYHSSILFTIQKIKRIENKNSIEYVNKFQENLFEFAQTSAHSPSNKERFSDKMLNKGFLNYTQIKSLLMEVGFSEQTIPTMYCIAKWESGLNPKAINFNQNNTVDVGLFQINSTWLKKCNTTISMLYNEKENSKCALTVFQKQGFPAWTTYNNKFKNSSYCAN